MLIKSSMKVESLRRVFSFDLQPAFIGCVNILVSWFDLELAFGPLIKNLIKTFINPVKYL